MAFVLAMGCVVSLAGCNNESIPNLNPNNETGWTVLHGIYVKTELGHDVFLYDPQNGEDMYIFPQIILIKAKIRELINKKGV